MKNEHIKNDELAAKLSHVLWVGGATDAGKTTTAKLLAERYGVQVYHQDLGFSSTGIGYDPETQTLFHEWMQMTEDERWLRSPEVLAQLQFDMWPQGFSTHIERILSISTDIPIIAEGYCFIPELIEPVLSSPYQALWMVPTKEFKHESFHRRGKDKYRENEGSSDPVRATHNFYTRDILIGERVQAEVERRKLKLIQADGTRNQDEVAGVAAEHFRHYLPECFGVPYQDRTDG